MNEFPNEIKRVFQDYREAHPDPEPSVNFTPMLWEKIEARRSSMNALATMKRLAHAMMSLSVAAALILGAFVIPQLQDGPYLAQSYAEVVAHDDGEQEVASAFTVPVSQPSVTDPSFDLSEQ